MGKEMIRLGLAALVGLSAVGCKKEQVASNPATSPVMVPVTVGSEGVPVSQPAGGDSGSNPLFTLPPSKGPAAHAFKQVTLLRSGVSGDLEMQLTGDGIYRIRDHGRGQSYAGNGKLEDADIAGWAALMADWESLKDNYVPDPAPSNADKIDIMYGGKKVSFSTGGKDNPPLVLEVYKRMLVLNDLSRKESGVP